MLTHSNSMRTMISLLALASACTLRPASLEGDDENADDEIGDDTDSESDSDDDTDGETDSDTTDSESETGEAASECIDDQGQLLRPALLLDEDNDSARLFVDGSEQTLAMVGPDHPQIELLAKAAGDHIAIARSSGWWGDETSTTVQSFSISTGELEWSREIPGVWISYQLWVGEEGGVSGTGIGPQQNLDGFAIVGETMVEFVDIAPLAAPHDGRVSARGFTGDYGWLDLEDESWIASSIQPAAGTSAEVAADGRTLEFVTEGDLGMEFVRATVDANQIIPLPTVPGVLHPSYTAGDFRVLVAHDGEMQSYIRVDIESGEALLLEPELPIGQQWFEGCWDRARALDPDGALVFMLHDGASVQAFSWRPETAEWTAIGLPVTATSHISLFASTGSVHVAQSTADLCEQLGWSDPPIDALLGDSLQLIRHQPAVAIELPPAALTAIVDGDERCAAYSTGEQWWVRALDGEAEITIGAGSWLWLD